MRRFALQFYLAITTIANCNLFFVFILLVPASGTAAATGSVAAAVCPEPQKATDTSALEMMKNYLLPTSHQPPSQKETACGPNLVARVECGCTERSNM